MFITNKAYISHRIILLICTVLIGFVSFNGFAQEMELKDTDIAFAVDNELIFDPLVMANYIDVTCDDGIVALKGTVENLYAKERAAKLATTIKGVRSVVNDIDVRPAMITDAQLKNDLIEAFAADPATESFEIQPAVLNGTVTLTGEVQSWQEKQLVSKVAKGVMGVRGVVNNIDVNYAETRADAEIAYEIKARLRNDAWVDHSGVDVAVNDGNVMLSGTVASAAEKNRAFADAWVAGVNSVKTDDLEVKWWLRDSMKKENAFSAMTDEEITTAVKDALAYDPRVLAYNIDVKSNNGLVTLSGNVDYLSTKMAAEADARNTFGVTWVNNNIKVRPLEIPGDNLLQARVNNALKKDPTLNNYVIRFTVNDGVVTVNGAVESLEEKIEAYSVIASVKGVVEVKNNLEVKESAFAKPDWAIRQDILDELYWNAYVNSDNVTVKVEDAIATLTGTVDDWRAYTEAKSEALEGGAIYVRNNLQVKGYPEDIF